MSQSRQLAAIMFTDIVGYTALMAIDDQKAFAILNKNRSIQKPIIEEFHGRWIKELGDGVMASFDSAADAVYAAIKIQEACNVANEFKLKIGIHLGEVVFENDDVFGDGVNVASRIESLGIAGSVLISKAIRDQLKNKSDLQLDSLGYFDFKNVSEPMEVFALANPGFAVPKREEMHGKLKQTQKKSGRLKWITLAVFIAAASFGIWFIMGQKKTSGETGDHSIAVLPFVDMSQAKDQEYFSDGLSENVIDLLAKVTALKVIGRSSSFSFKGKNEDLRMIGEKLGAANILEGSVQRDGNKLRITAQLIRSADGFHLWSEKFDRELKDIFAIQDEISLAILKAIKVKLLGSEKNAVLKRYTDNVEAYQLYLQGRFHYNKYTPDALMKAIEYFDRAIAMDPNYAIAFAGKSYCYMTLEFFGLSRENNLSLALEAAQKSLDLDGEIAHSHLAVGRFKFHQDWNFKQAEEHFMKALSIEPNNAECHVQLAMLSTVLGNKEIAMKHYQIAISLDPFSLMNLYMATTAPGMFGEMQTVLENGKRMIDLDSTFYGGHFWVGFAHMQSGRPQEGFVSLQLAVQLGNDALTLSFMGSVYGFMGDKLKAREVIKQLESMQQVNGYIGDVYVSIGELDKAFFYYNKAVEMHEGNMLWAKNAWLNNPELKKDPRTMKLLDRIGIPY